MAVACSTTVVLCPEVEIFVILESSSRAKWKTKQIKAKGNNGKKKKKKTTTTTTTTMVMAISWLQSRAVVVVIKALAVVNMSKQFVVGQSKERMWPSLNDASTNHTFSLRNK